MEALILEIEKHVSSLLNNELPREYVYHNLSHTQRVVAATKEIAEAEEVSESDMNALVVAAWFHDTGYMQGSDNHEENGVVVAKNYLIEKKIDTEFIAQVSQLILATKMDYEPQNHLEKIIRDADCSHFPLKNYDEIGELLRREWERVKKEFYPDSEWLQMNISFFTKNHRFYTNYALENWQSGKDKNLARLFKSLNKIEKEEKRNKKKSEELALKKNKATLFLFQPRS